MSTPYIGFTNDTLAAQPKAHIGERIACNRCGDSHALEAADDGGTLLMFYRCGEKNYLGAINGRLVAGLRADVSGTIE